MKRLIKNIDGVLTYIGNHNTNSTGMIAGEVQYSQAAIRDIMQRLHEYEMLDSLPAENEALAGVRKGCFDLIDSERHSQDAKWGYPQENSFAEWAAILSEESGELCKELVDLNWGRGDKVRMVNEAIQVAAVAVSIIEQYDTALAVTGALNVYRHKPEQAEK